MTFMFKTIQTNAAVFTSMPVVLFQFQCTVAKQQVHNSHISLPTPHSLINSVLSRKIHGERDLGCSVELSVSEQPLGPASRGWVGAQPSAAQGRRASCPSALGDFHSFLWLVPGFPVLCMYFENSTTPFPLLGFHENADVFKVWVASHSVWGLRIFPQQILGNSIFCGVAVHRILSLQVKHSPSV